MFTFIFCATALVLGAILAFILFTAWGTRWGATPAEYTRPMTGDAYFTGASAARVSMTRAISLNQPPEVVWPWLAQLGRGAGWYSYDRLDNGGKASARHLVSWIPAPQPGDATAIGYLRQVHSGRELVWWVSGERFLGATVRMMVDIRLTQEAGGSRVVIRIAGDAAGPTAPLVMGVFQVIDTIMARRQLLGLKERVETYGGRPADPDQPENGRPDQYQSYAIIYASGKMAGDKDRENISRWRQLAIDDKILVESEEETQGRT